MAVPTTTEPHVTSTEPAQPTPPAQPERPARTGRLVPTARRWLTAATRHLREARDERDPRVRYIEAHMAALRAAAAVVAQRRAEKGTRRSQPRSVWEQLPPLAPHLAPWVGVFLDSADRRTAIEATLAADVHAAEAHTLLCLAENFVAEVRGYLKSRGTEPE